MTAAISEHSWKQPDLDELQARLTSLPGNQNNTFTSGVWSFTNHRGALFNINFDDVFALSTTNPEWFNTQGIDPVPLIKQLWLSLAERLTVADYITLARTTLLWMTAMARHNILTVTKENLPVMLRFLLTHTWSANGAIRIRNLRSYSMTLKPSIGNIREACEGLQLPWFERGLSEHHSKNVLTKLIPDLTDGELTYRDWKSGQSFNLLTLDHGRYYVEHCLNFFEQHAPLAIALNQTLKDASQIAKTLGLKPQTVRPLLPRILEGFSVEQIASQCPEYLGRVQKAALAHFQSIYRQTRYEHELLQDGTLAEIACRLGLTTLPENVDRLRIVIWNCLQKGEQEETERLLREFQKPIPWSRFEPTLEVVRKRSCAQPFLMPTEAHFNSLGLKKFPRGKKGRTGGHSLVLRFISLVAKAGLTCVVALTGWRRSEYGWPFSAIQLTRNTDKLDEYAFPHRYQVDWYVEKTNGRVRDLREVTFSTVTIAKRLQHLTSKENDEPCLYVIRENKSNPYDSRRAISLGVTALWQHFVQHYSGFNLIDDWDSWRNLAQAESSGNLLTTAQHCEKERLLALRSVQEWDNLVIDRNLREAWRRCREEWPRLSFFWSKNALGSDWVIRYRQGTLRSDWAVLLNTYLSDETQEWLLSLSEPECKSLTIGRTLSDELVHDTLYPSPHAFRHMWAEAVYRRFDGDAGWMIRSQFKHISRTMWLAYVRDKDNRGGHQRAKLQVIHSLVRNYVNHHGEGYAGQMSKLLRRLFRKTHILSPQQQLELADQLATQEIENLKANPWGYCLLMRRTRHRAKCAEGGEPMRHNASPELCLGCIHNLMQTTNVEWMLLQIAGHVEAVNNPIVPDIFKQSSYELVKNTTRHLRMLDATHEALPELETLLKSHQSRTT